MEDENEPQSARVRSLSIILKQNKIQLRVGFWEEGVGGATANFRAILN